MKAIAVILSLVALALLGASSTAAQQDLVNLHFRVTVNTTCPNATYWGFFGVPNSDDVNYVQLADQDGDGIYTGTGTHTTGRLGVQIIQGTGTKTISGGPLFPELEVPGDPSRVIRDFGVEQPDQPVLVPHLIITEDMTFEASVSSCPAALPDTGLNDMLPVVPLAGGVLLLTAGIYLRRRMWRHA